MIKDEVATILDKSVAEIALVADKLLGVVIIQDFNIKDWLVSWMCKLGLEIQGITLEEYYSGNPNELIGNCN